MPTLAPTHAAREKGWITSTRTSTKSTRVGKQVKTSGVPRTATLIDKPAVERVPVGKSGKSSLSEIIARWEVLHKAIQKGREEIQLAAPVKTALAPPLERGTSQKHEDLQRQLRELEAQVRELQAKLEERSGEEPTQKQPQRGPRRDLDSAPAVLPTQGIPGGSSTRTPHKVHFAEKLGVQPQCSPPLRPLTATSTTIQNEKQQSSTCPTALKSAASVQASVSPMYRRAVPRVESPRRRTKQMPAEHTGDSPMAFLDTPPSFSRSIKTTPNFVYFMHSCSPGPGSLADRVNF
eukprot:TRINITY_DN11430_c0_g1_i1.p1 TRINITY_DN11430_c0_g1~~TRINITY_DN11430_c0_g1_i1.p1  ORF type:complete len:330 (-),score=25.14 TRINITY_DN11430_c0_g1_i1:664-1539(-)